MAYDEGLAQRIRDLMGEDPALTERKMFGGLCFMTGGNMYAGVINDELMVRVGADAHDEWLARPGARPMEMGGRTSRGMLFVDGSVVASDAALKAWLDQAYGVASKLPAKEPGTKSRTRKRAR